MAARTGSPSAGSSTTKHSPKSQNSCLERTDRVLPEAPPRQAARALPGPARAEQPCQWAGGSGDKVTRSQWQDPAAETPYPASPLASATMKQMPWAWQKSPMRSCSSSGDSVSTTTCMGAVSGHRRPRGPRGMGARAHLEGGEESLRQLPGVSCHHHVGVQLGQNPLGRLGTVLTNVTVPQEELWGGHMVGHPVSLGCCPPQQGAPWGPARTGGGPSAGDNTHDTRHSVGPAHHVPTSSR